MHVRSSISHGFPDPFPIGGLAILFNFLGKNQTYFFRTYQRFARFGYANKNNCTLIVFDRCTEKTVQFD